MRNYNLKAILKAALRVACLLPFAAVAALGQQQVNLTAGPTTAALPDGSVVPMWGYTCGAATAGSLSPVIGITNGGTGYAVGDSIVFTGGGSGAGAVATVSAVSTDGNASITAISVTSTGSGYTSAPSVSVTSAGSGAVLAASVNGMCAALNPNAGAGWSPIIITVPTGQDLTINLTNNLTFTAGTGSNTVPTSLVIVGQLGGGLGRTATLKDSPTHATQGATWPIAGDSSGATFNPPPQGQRVQSFSTEVSFGATTALTWKAPRPGTYLLESGTHPSIQGPMGLYGMLVVTCAPTDTTSGCTTGTAYPGVSYNADVPLLLSEIDAAQNKAVIAAVTTVNFSETAARVLRDSVSSVSLALDPITGNVMSAGSGYHLNDPIAFTGGGLSGAATVIAVAHVSSVDSNGAITGIVVDNPGHGYSSVPDVAVTRSVPPASTDTDAQIVAALSLAGVMCSDGAAACYPPAVNYTPLYYLFNGVAFDKTRADFSRFPAVPTSGLTPLTGNVLVRFVNAGLRMHIPSIVGSQTGTATPAVSGFSLVAEDGNPLPGVRRVQSEVFLAAGKTYDLMINVPASGANALPVYDRELSLSGNATARDAGMLAYIGINGSTLPTSGVFANAGAVARDDAYNSLIAGQTLTVSDASKGVIANDTNVSGVQLLGAPSNGTVTLNPNGTFTYVPSGTATSDSFTYCANGSVTGTTCSSNVRATVTLGAAAIESASSITCNVPTPTYSSTVATSLSIKSPGVLSFCKDAAGYPLTVNAASVTGTGFTTLSVDKSGAFNAIVPGAGAYAFMFKAQNSQGTLSASAATITLVFPAGSGLAVTVLDGADKTTQIKDYRWIIEEDRTFYIDPKCTTNPPAAGCPSSASGIVPTFGTNFHTSYMPVIAAGCTGTLSCEGGQTVVDPQTGAHSPAVCDVGNGVCRTTDTQETPVDPSLVALNPNKRYYISVLPGDAANPFIGANVSVPTNCAAGPNNPDGSVNTSCGHGMGGAPITFGQKAVTILTQPTPFPPAKLSVFVFEDDFPLNGEHDAGGGVDIIATNEPGLGSFQITLYDDAGGSGDATGTPTYDMFNMPLSNSLAGTIDPATGQDACPISPIESLGFDNTNSPLGMTGMIVTCPKYEKDGTTLSPLAGQAVIANLYPGRYGVVATPAADRIARGEEWLQTNTLDGQKAHDSFLRIGEPSFFQEFGPAGYHVSIGFANPKIINSRLAGICGGTDPVLTAPNCTNTVTGLVTTERMSRTPDERLYSSGDNSSFAFTQCYVSIGDPDGEDFAFTKCDANGKFTMSGLPDGNWRITVFDQWNDMLVDGLSTPVLLGSGATTDMGQIAMNQWQANIYTKTFLDLDGNGVQNGTEPGLTLVSTNIRFRDGSYSNFNNTDLAGNAGFNEIFPLFSWYVIETDSTRYKNTGVHVVYDAGGPADGCDTTTGLVCGNSTIASMLANTAEQIPVPQALRVPGARYCKSADCPTGDTAGGSTGRIDPAWVESEGWQGFSGQNSFVEFGKKPFATGENGGIRGEVIYASTRPFDDPMLLIHTSWTPDVPGVTINLYQEGTAPDGSQSLKLVDTTKTSSWDDWAQGFRSDGKPNMNCPGQGTASGTNADLFFFSLFNQPNYLDVYNNGTGSTALPNNSQFKCYDGMHNWNQVQPAPYDGAYRFPSVTALDPTTGKPAGTNCAVCVPNPDSSDSYRFGTPMLPAGKYVVEVVVPPGYELVKEEDKNILIGDNYIAPVTQQFAGLGNIFIIPDQAAIGGSYNPNNPQNPTQDLGSLTLPRHEGDTGSVEEFWPCVGASRIVPDYISLFPQSAEVAPFAGATRNLCDRKEITLQDQASALAKFWIFSSVHVAAHFTGVITDDFTSEFDPFSPQFGEKFSPANLPIAIKDWSGSEIARVYSDHWGSYNGLTYSTWEVNPPNPTGYGPTMMVTCMNDPGPGVTPDPLYNPAYSQFCYEIPFMPGQTQYMDTPVVPTSGFAGAGYNNPDCAYPDATPAIKEVDGAGVGPWVHIPQGSVDSLTVGNPGSGYNATFGFTMNGDSGTGATGQVTDLKLVAINSIDCGTTGNNRCSNFAVNPIVTIDGGGGSGATATATKTSSGTITFAVTAPGSGYTSRPTVTIPRLNGSTRTVGSGNVSMGVNGVTLTADGSGYTTSPFTFNITGHGGSGLSVQITVSNVRDTLTIMALGNQNVNNYGYSGPSTATAPYNQKTVTRHYGFGAPPTADCNRGSTSSAACPNVTVGGVRLRGVTWNDTTITAQVPANVPLCAVQQQSQYGGSTAFCGELVITAANGKQSIDAVTVTIGGKAPTHVSAADTIQSKIDGAAPGDLIIVDPAIHNELLLMWKPVQLQGVGAASSIINANTHPAGKLLPWRAAVNCLFGLAINGQPYTAVDGSNPYDVPGGSSCPGTGWKYFSAMPNSPQVDRIPREGIVGWDATLNGNLAEMLQEPSLMGAYEGAGITVLSKGVIVPSGTDPFGSGAEADFPAGSTLLTASDCATGAGGANLYPSNFHCNPSSIDGLSITNSSQGGGGILVHGWGHNLQIANNRVMNNAGTLSGGISIGQGEFTDAYLAPNSGTIAPGSCEDSPVDNTQLPYCFYLHVNVHHNAVMLNSSTGDELFSATPAGAGGVSFCTGADYYKFNYNWICGNLSTGDGGGAAHLGFSKNGDIEHNQFLFNQSTNPTIATNGGGLIVQGAPPDGFTAGGLECGTVTDVDCVPGLSDGTGPGLVINANLFLGNAAESGSGGGLRFQAVNGTDVPRFPANPEQWYRVTATNNIIANNVAGWDGAGVSLEDALVVDFINNTVVSNDTTASSGVLFNTLGAPLASSQSPPSSTNIGTTSLPQAAGLVVLRNSPPLTSSFVGIGPITCPTNHPNCTSISYPLLANDLFWQNRSFYIGVGGLGAGTQNQQSVVTLYNAFASTLTPAQSQPQVDATTANGGGRIITGGTGACVQGNTNYWDIGVRGDTGPGNHSSGFSLAPRFSVLTNTSAASEVGAGSNDLLGSNPTLVSQYCNGSRVPPELGSMGYQVPPGIADATVPNPIFSLTPAATVDEGNNWINIAWGPLSLTNPSIQLGSTGFGVPLGNYALAAGSPAIDAISIASPTYGLAPSTDFFGNPRPDDSGSAIDIGAVEAPNSPSPAAPTLGSISVPSGVRGTTVGPITLTGANFGGLLTTVNAGAGITVNNVTVNSATQVTATFVIGVGAPLGNHNVSVTTAGGTSTNAVTFRVLGATVSFSGPTPAMNVGGGSITKTATITVNNTASGANAGPLTLTAAPTFTRVSGAGTGTFSITGGSCISGAVINPGGNCTILLRYVPSNTSTAMYRVTITDTGDSQTSRNSSNFPVN